VKVAIVSEFYPRAHDPVLGVWAHRQALAARDAGADVRVLVLHRPVPPRSTRLRDAPRALRTLASQPRHAELDGLDVRYVPFFAPPRSRTYGS
jgi:teichuronic acid biosynthesis glycosyltransferase TuaC